MIIYETSNPSVKDTVLFSFNVGTLAGVKDITNPTFNIYPNPTNTCANIIFDQSKISQVVLYSLDGREAMKVQPNMNGTIDVNALPVGTYIVTILDKQNKSYRQTLIKN